MDLSKDPDRFVPDPVPTGPLDPAADPDRFDAAKDHPGRGRTLPELLGEGAHEDKRDTMTWLFGLLGVLLFLAVVSVLLSLA